MSSRLPPLEIERLAYLQSLRVLDTAPDDDLDDLVAFAKELASAPIALITLVDRDRQWFKARIGMDDSETHRDLAFCAHALLQSDVLWIPDALLDQRFAENPLVTGKPNIRFYAGAPLISAGHVLGTLCVIDTEPREYEPELAKHLERLAELATKRIIGAHERELFAGIVAQSPDGIVCVGPDEIITHWNPAAERILGSLSEHAIGRPWPEIVPLELRLSFETSIQQGRQPAVRPTFQTCAMRRADGEMFHVEMGLIRTGERTGHDVAVIVRDLSDRERILAKLQLANSVAERADRAKSTFLANMGHELRTPMNGIIGMLQLVRQGPLTAESDGVLKTAQLSARHLHKLLERVLTYSQIGAGSSALDPSDVDLAQLIAGAAFAAGFGPDAGVITAFDDNTGRRVRTDVSRLSQILELLIENALRFAGPDVRVAVSVHCDELEPRLQLAIEDTGPGVAIDQQALIFDDFHQSDASDTRSRDGAGLGLPLARALAQSMGGDLTLDTTYSLGARFLVSLPFEPALVLAEDDERAVTCGAEAERQPTLLRILLAEDHPVNEQVLLGMLQIFGQTADVARNGAEALAAARTQDYDLILMDIQMPVMDGIAATVAIGSHYKGRLPPVFAVTASATQQDLHRYRAAGMVGLIAKPVRPEELLVALETAAAARESLVSRERTSPTASAKTS